ncbi:MAG: arabinan endo-1,5-alpha-L-arabinosidase, partial [Proteiniphilum sp.]
MIQMKKILFMLAGAILLSACVSNRAKEKRVQYSGNPIFEGWYADPEGIIYDNQYWIFPTYSNLYEKQVF